MPELLSRTREEALSAVAEIRRVLDGLRPSALDLHGLEGAFRDVAAALGFDRAGGPLLELRTGRLPLLAPAVEEATFRIVAESMTNVARHASARRCSVALNGLDGHLRIEVTDDGTWLPGSDGDGHGLASMERRALDVGGSLDVGPASDGGTRVSAILPLAAR